MLRVQNLRSHCQTHPRASLIWYPISNRDPRWYHGSKDGKIPYTLEGVDPSSARRRLEASYYDDPLV